MGRRRAKPRMHVQTDRIAFQKGNTEFRFDREGSRIMVFRLLAPEGAVEQAQQALEEDDFDRLTDTIHQKPMRFLGFLTKGIEIADAEGKPTGERAQKGDVIVQEKHFLELGKTGHVVTHPPESYGRPS